MVKYNLVIDCFVGLVVVSRTGEERGDDIGFFQQEFISHGARTRAYCHEIT